MRDFFFFILLALIVIVQCETIHFTNSPSHLVGTKNITSYKLLMKNSDPITIIEANKEIRQRPHIQPSINYNEHFYPIDRIDTNIDDGTDFRLPDYHVKLVSNLGGSHQVEPAHEQNFRGTVGITITGGPSDRPTSSLNENEKIDQDHEGEASNLSAKKVVYSPILLKKFMKEYSEKLKNADPTVKNEIQKIHEKIHHQLSMTHEQLDLPLEFDKSIEEMEQKYNLNGYRDGIDDDRHNRYKDRDGWVQLEAVPWSSSSVSKWHPHSYDTVEDTRKRPSVNSARPYNRKPGNKFSYHDEFENDRNDYYGRPKPAYMERDRPGVYSTWIKSHSMNDNGRPRPQPYRYGESIGSHKFNDRDHQSSPSPQSRPWNNGGDIITDNRPSDFPAESHSSHPSHSSHYQPNQHHQHPQDDDHFNTASSNLHSTYQDRPSESNGEWVLISKTKGYQGSGDNRRQHGKRATETQTSVIFNAPQSMRVHKALKITVLPALDTAKNSTFSTDSKRKPTTTIHGGMLEVDATHETMDEAVRATLQAQKKQPHLNSPVKLPSTENKNKNRKLLKGNFKLEERSA